MTGLVITQAALHAALRRARDDGTYGSLDTLLTLLDPAHAAGGGAAWATTPEAKRPAEPCYDEAGTPAPPTIELPAGPAEVAPAASDTPAVKRAEHARSGPSVEQAAEGRQPAPKPQWGGRPICVWTPERVAMLRERLPTCLDDEALLAALNALPAQLPVSSVGSMRNQAAKIGVQRDGAIIRQIMQAGARKGLPRANEERLKLLGEESPPASPAPMRAHAMTPDRLAAFPALWQDVSLSVGDIQARLNAMPGKPMASSTQLYGWAKKAGLSTHRGMPDEAPDIETKTTQPRPQRPRARNPRRHRQNPCRRQRAR